MIVLTCVECTYNIMGTFIFIINIIHLFVYCLFVCLFILNLSIAKMFSFRQCHMRHRYYKAFRHYFDRKNNGHVYFSL